MLSATRRIAVAALVLFVATTAMAQVSLTTIGSAYTQNFDTLVNSGTSTTMPAGWAFSEAGTSANTTYTAGTGSLATGDTYSFGASAATDRALGGLQSGTLIPTLGASFINNTGTTITSVVIGYTGEEWRLGTAARTDKLDFQYSTDATSLTTGTWTDFDTLDFTTPDTATIGAKNGNAAADRTVLGPLTITGLSIPNGATFWIRWSDFNASGADDGLAVDDFSITPQGVPPNNPPSITPPANPITSVAQDAAPFTVGLTGSDDNSIYNWSATPGTGVASVNVTGGQGTASVTYTVTLTAGYSGTATFQATLTDNVNTPVNQAVNITVIPPPPTPTGFAAAAGTGHIALSWNSSAGATSYNVKRSTSSGTETTLSSPGTNSFDDLPTVDGTPYFYVVSAVGAGGESGNSSEVTATSIAAPTGLAATPGNNHVVLNWNTVVGATGYNVKRSTTTGTETTLAPAATNTYDDLTASNGVPYFYVVTATNANGESIASSEVTATPNPPGVIVISQVYGGAGCGTVGCSTYKNDYIELFNRGGSPVSVNGWSVQYASATGTTWQVTNLPNVSIQPGQYFLVAEGAGANGVSVLPTPDVTGTIAMSATAAKVALVNSTTALSGACPVSATIVDLVGFGATANCSETAPAPAPSTTTADLRASGGCVDAGNNSTDFATGAPTPRNTSSPTHSCVNTPPTIVPPGNPITTVTMDAAPFPVSLSGNDDGGIYNWSATPGTGVSSVIVSGGQGTNSVTYTVSLVAAYTGTATFTANLTDNVTTPASQVVNITVNPPAPPPAPTGLNATPGNAHVQLNWNGVGGATSYTVKRGTAPGGPYGTTFPGIGTNSYDDVTAANGTTYYYVVSATGPGGEGANSSEVSATPATAPAAPTGLAATPGVSHVALTWNASGGATSYTVKRGTAPGGPYGTTFPGIVTTSYDDTTAVNGITYAYVVVAVNGQGPSGNSNEVSATPAPLVAPTPVTAAVSDATVVLNWGPVQGAATYNVKRSTTPGGPYSTVGSPAATSYTDNTVANTITYYYVVSAVAGPEGPDSTEVSATPNTPAFLGVVVSQVYGGGGNAGATLKNDYVELYNRGTQTVSLAGWYVHYTSAGATTWASANSPTALVGTIAPGQHYLLQEAQGAGGTTNLPTPDATGTIAMGATGGKIALTTAVTLTGQCPTGASMADFVGYGAANCFEGSGPTGVTANTTAALRNNSGCTDTNNNASDFTVGIPNPHNTASGISGCAPIDNPPSITTPSNPIATVTQDDPPFTVTLHGTDDGGIYNWSATTGTGIQSVNVTGGQGTADVTYTVTLVAGFHGFATFTATLTDNVNTPVNQSVNIQVNQVGGGNNSPLIIPPANPVTSVAQDAAPFTVGLTGSDDGGVYNWTATPGTGVASVNVTGGQGTTNVTYTVTLSAGFNGTATFTATLSDNVNPPVNQPVNITVTPTGGPSSHLVISQVYGGGGNSGAPYTNDFVELYNPTASPVNVTGWSIQYSSATNTGAFSGIQGLGGIIGPGEYYLIGLAGGATGAPLPTPNVSNTGINLSGTTGKVALVNDGTPLTGSCPAPLTDANTVDFVGYGTANCAEGNADAPAPSNSTAIFRKNNGTTDTDNNATDFITGTPNPRRTTPIGELGPSITTTDPFSGATVVPRDGSVIVTFSEAVTVDPGWYDITCVTTGNHNSATTALGPGNSWVIIPNTNFQAGETCTATVFASFVHDVDTDDSAPGSDTLPADQSWSFSIATGSAPPYPPGVHTTMGIPSVCVADLLSPNSYLMMKPENTICYNRDYGRPNWVSWHLTDEWNGTLPRNDTFRADPEVPAAWYRVLGTDFQFSGFDRGHMTPNADRDLQTSVPINQSTYLMSNMVAQAPDNNQGPWADLENYLRTFLPANELYIISGPNGVGGTGSNGGTTTTLANGHVTVPASTWKVVMFLPKATGDDVARVTASTHTLAVIMPNVQGIRNNDWHIYLTSVDAVESLTGYDFFSNVPPAIQAAIEGGVDGVNPPGTASQSTSTNEDVAKSITLDAATPGGSLTYSILTGPFHGSLTGSGANRTYTPAPDYNGTDTFTWRVNDGTNNSNTSTFTITVLEVNDPPTATNDSKTTTANGVLTFPGSDLTANDSTGPANESGQTLTVSSVSPTANTHGTVLLSAGQVTYTPAPAYSGPADFTYSVCDDGVTVGLADPKCTTATVNVTVNPQVTTHFSVTAPANVTSGVAFNVTVTALDASNATVTSYTGTAHFTSSSAGTLPADYTFTGGDSGSHTFSVTLTTTGLQSVTATDTVTASITGTASTTVAAPPPPPATHFSVTAPANVTAGVAFNVTVTALDAGNATATGYTGTVHFTSTSAGTLPADYTFTGGDSGSHTFSVTLTTTGSQSITATDTVTASITGTASTTVASAPPLGATHYSVSAPANVTAGVAFNVTVTALDAGNATATGYTGTVHFTTSAGSSTLPADYTFVAGDNGSHTFSVTLNSTGGQSITATDTVTPSITGTASTTVACPALSVTATNDGPACIGGTVTLNASTANGGVTFAWTGPGGFSSTQQSPTTTVAGTYTVTITGAGGCTASSSTNVSFNNAPNVVITTPSTTCAYQANVASVPDAGPGATYNWTVPGGTIMTGAGTSSITYSAPAGPLTISISIQTAGGCAGSGTANVTVVPRPTVTIPESISVCGPQTISIPVTLTGTGPWTIYWSDGFTQTSNTATTTRSYNATVSTTLGIQQVADASCNASAPSPNLLHINVNTAAVITTQPHDTFVPGGGSATFTVAATGDGLHYQWYLQNGNNGSSSPVGTDSPSFTMSPVHGNFTVWVVITNACGTTESLHVHGGVESSRRRVASH